MPQFNPLFITLALLVLAITVAVIFASRRHVLAGYSEIRREVLRLSRVLGARPFRENGDLVLEGNYERRPVQVRFSNSDNAPALSISMAVPATFQFSLVPRSASARKEGRFVLRTEDPFLDSAFITSSDQPAQARLFTDNREVKLALKTIGRSSSIYLSVAPGFMTLSEPTLSSANPADVIDGYLGSMGRLAERFLAMPGATAIKIEPYKKPESLLARVVVGVALIIALIGAWRLHGPAASTTPAIASVPSIPAGMSQADADAIPGANNWRLLQEADFDPALGQWLRDQEIVPSGRISGDFSGRGNSRDVVYLLGNKDGVIRIVVLSQGKSVSDFAYRHLAIAARVPNSALSGVSWRAALPSQPDGDGLLLVQAPNDPTSASVLILSSGRVLQALPEDYKTLNLSVPAR